jgi:hypothetical protein
MSSILFDPTTTSGEHAPKLEQGRPVTVPGAESFDFTSRITGREHRLFISVPTGDAPPEGFPVFYILDGNGCFATVSEIMRGRAPADGLRPAIVVAIGYSTDDLMTAMALRMKDLSTPATSEWLAALPFAIPGLTADLTGGLDDFIRVVEEEIRPAVARLAPTNPSDQTVMGHSLGGLAVLRMLFTRPGMYRTFEASSPSIWWSDHAILAAEKAFCARVAAGEASPRLLIEVGGREQTADSGALRHFKSMAEAQASAEFCGMVGNARALGQRLETLKGGKGYVAETVVFTDEGHVSVLPAAISRGLQFALGVDVASGSTDAR